MKTRFLACAAGLSMTAAGAMAGTTYFATKGKNLYRVSDQGVETFRLDYKLNSMAFDADGRLFGTTKHDTDGDGNYEFIEIVDPFGAGIASVSRGDFVSANTGTIFFKDPTLVGFDKDGNQLVDIDMGGQSADPMGPVIGSGGANFGSSAYDALTDTIYAIKNNRLYTVNQNGSDYDLNQIATLWGGETTGKLGGEWYNGQYYHAVNDGNFFHVYTVDLETGELTEVMNWATAGPGPLGFAVADSSIVPAPGVASVLALGGICALRRRRR